MNKKLLNQFFKRNTVEDETPTAQALAHFFLMMDNDLASIEKVNELLDKEMSENQPEREKEISNERSSIETATTYEEIVKIMRRNTDPLNQHILINKAMEFEDDIVPDIIKRLKTSLNTGFIETSIRILAKTKKDVAEELFGYFDDMRNPYAQSMVLILLGYKADEVHIPWFIEKYNEMKKLYPNENYCEGAYYALIEMENRFYPVEGKKK